VDAFAVARLAVLVIDRKDEVLSKMDFRRMMFVPYCEICIRILANSLYEFWEEKGRDIGKRMSWGSIYICSVANTDVKA